MSMRLTKELGSCQRVGARRVWVAMATVLLCVVLAGCGDVAMTSGGGASTGETLEERVASGLSVKAERGSKTLDIQRTSPTGKRPSGIESGTWTVFVYMCGSDLESNGGAATADLGEMVGASGSEDVKFVVETGGAKQWRSNVESKNLGRYLIQDGAITEVDSVKAADMGQPNTLSDFLSWGLKNYPAEHMGVILWNHGGGSISGVCFDERNNYDSLLLRELDLALAQTNLTMWQKFDFIGFDACLMGTLETANVLATYADYMYASEEVEPGTGWEYSSIMEYLAQNPTSSANDLGKALCDGYMESLPGSRSASATLSVVDLSQVDQLMQDFYGFSQEIYESGSDQGTLAAMTRGIRSAESYGTNNWAEGYTNMVDLGGIVDACASVTPSADDVQADLSRAVTYQVRGRSHAGSSGLSLYYPIKVSNAQELTTFETVAANPSYISYVDRLAHGATYNGGSQYTSYSNDSWFLGGLGSGSTSSTGSTSSSSTGSSAEAFDSSELWNLLVNEETLSLLLGMRSMPVDPRWEYVEEHDDTSQVVTFAEEPQVDDEGIYWMQFDEEGINNVASASGLVYAQAGDAQITLGETYEVWADWDTGEVEDGFDGKWLSLPDGQNLCLYVVESNEDEVVFTSPIRLNGEECYLRMVQDLESGAVEVEGAWMGAGENGLVSRDSIELVEGDVIVPLYSTTAEAGAEATGDFEVAGEEYTVGAEGLTIDYGDLPQGSYKYSFNIVDVYGDRYVTDQVQFDVEPDGIYFVE